MLCKFVFIAGAYNIKKPILNNNDCFFLKTAVCAPKNPMAHPILIVRCNDDNTKQYDEKTGGGGWKPRNEGLEHTLHVFFDHTLDPYAH